MSDDLVPYQDAPAPAGAGAQAVQKVGVLAAKAALSTIPWAALVFDLGQAAIDFGNARLTDRLLGSLGERIDRLETGARERLATDEVYQISAQAAIRRMLTETNPRMADALARAVATLGASELPDHERMEIVRALDVLTEPSLHLLQTLYRACNGMLRDEEITISGGPPPGPEPFTRIIVASMPLLSWIGPVNDLERVGLIPATLDGGEVMEGGAIRTFLAMNPAYPLGERVIRMCFDDPAVAAFGAFAEPGITNS